MTKEPSSLTKIIRAAIYMRVSTGTQAKRDLSIPDQRRQLREYCAAKSWGIVEEYSDARTGRDGNRPGFQNMLDAARVANPPFDVILVHSFSRFFRDQVELELRTRELAKYGIQLVSITQEVSNDATGDLVRSILAKFDEYNSLETGKHVSRSMAENARQGFFSGGVPPFGFQAVGVEKRGNTIKKKLVLDEKQAELIQHIYDLYRFGDGKSGPKGVKKITTWLNANGYKTRNGARWGIGPVHRLLTDPIYKGEYWRETSNGNKQPILVRVPAIVSTEGFDDVQRRLRARNPKSTPPRTISTPTLLAGLAVCPFCGGGMLLSTGKGGKYRYYACGSRLRKGDTACVGLRVRMDQTDDLVVSAMLKDCLAPGRLSKLLNEFVKRKATGNVCRADRLSRQQRHLSEVKEKMARLLSMVEKGIMDVSEPVLADRLADLKVEHELAKKTVDATTAQLNPEADISEVHVSAFAALLREHLTTRGAPMRQSYLRSIFGRIEIDKTEIRIYAKDDCSKLSAFHKRNRKKRKASRWKLLYVVPR